MVMKVVLRPPDYSVYNIPDGFLRPKAACHALFHYAVTARNNWEIQHDEIVYEDEPEKIFDYHQLFKSIAFLYGVEPEEMVHYWSYVDMQLTALRLPKLAQELRFTNVPNITTEN